MSSKFRALRAGASSVRRRFHKLGVCGLRGCIRIGVHLINRINEALGKHRSLFRSYGVRRAKRVGVRYCIIDPAEEIPGLNLVHERDILFVEDSLDKWSRSGEICGSKV